ncbi:MAG: hypothetical protein EOQ35_27025 [Mesorhizobium sp.]|nr:MAG: hypothetical protein EOQ35_27025 [Mesorhizobium sp.]
MPRYATIITGDDGAEIVSAIGEFASFGEPPRLSCRTSRPQGGPSIPFLRGIWLARHRRMLSRRLANWRSPQGEEPQKNPPAGGSLAQISTMDKIIAELPSPDKALR